MKRHLSDEQLNGYAHYTLTDAARETMREHLAACPDCRARLDACEALQRRIRYDLAADIKAVSLPTSMTYAAIAPRLQRQGWRNRRSWPSLQLVPGATALAALVGLAVALIGLLQSLGWQGTEPPSAPENAWSMLACGCFAVTVMGNYTWKSLLPPNLILSRALAFLLWIGTAIIGLQVLTILYDMLRWVLFSASHVVALSIWALLPLGIGWIVLVVGGGEYHYQHVGQRSSWQLFAWTIALELFILILPYVLASWLSFPYVWGWGAR